MMLFLIAVTLTSCLFSWSSAINMKCAAPDIYSNCTSLKCSRSNLPNCESVVDACIAGNQICDKKMLGVFSNGHRRKRQAYNFGTDPAMKWSMPIQYFFNTTINQDSYKQTIRNALNHVKAQTCVQFTEVTTEPATSHIVFNLDNQGCVSFVGKPSNPQAPILATASCLSQFGEMLSLIVQSLGLWHESQRSDRDQYIKINFTNMDPSHSGDFATVPDAYLLTYGLPYDYASVMQYPAKVFSSNGLFTISTIDPLYQHTIGQRVELSFQDAELINKMYCSASCSNQVTCSNGGYQDPNNCQICKCPSGFTGNQCQNYDTTTSTVVSPNDCGGELTASPTEATLSSPGYLSPQYYTANTKCTWRINAPNGGNVSIRFFDSFGIYSDSSYACYHWLEIRYKGQMNATGPRFCGQDLPQDVLVSSNSQVMLLFRSNLTGQSTALQRGFKIAYRVVNPPPCAYVTCQNGGVCSNNVCQCTAGWVGVNCETPPTPTGGSDPCQSNPCQNNGTCVANGNSFTCQCLSITSGDLCQHANCGGCDVKPGLVDPKCIYYGNPPKICSRTESSETCTNSWWRERSCKTRSFTVQYYCVNATFCCSNAVDLGVGCATTGWSDWSSCTQPCGTGTQYQYNYGMKETATGMLYTAIQTNQQPCNTQDCPSPPPSKPCGFWRWLFNCC